MSPKTKGIVILVAVYVFGGLTGAAVVRFLAARHAHAMLEQPAAARQRLFMFGLDREVHLDKDQRQKIRAILKEREQELREANRQCQPKAKDVRKAALEQVRGVMHPDQMEGFERFSSEAERIGNAAPTDDVKER